MIRIRNIKGNNPFFHVLFRKTTGYFSTLLISHHANQVSPHNFLFRNWALIKQSCRFRCKSRLKQFLSSLAPILILIADKQNIHARQRVIKQYKLYAKTHNLWKQLYVLANSKVHPEYSINNTLCHNSK